MLRKPSTKPCQSAFMKAANAVATSPSQIKPMPIFRPFQAPPNLASPKPWSESFGASVSTKRTSSGTKFGPASSTIPLETMETKTLLVSELIALLQQCLAEFGDIPVGAYSAEYCYELGRTEDLMDISLRVMSSYAGSSADNLPGINLAGDRASDFDKQFLTIFYNDK